MKSILFPSHYLKLNESNCLSIRREPTITRTGNRFKEILIVLWFFCLLLFSKFSSAQETLVGLTSNGGPEGKGTAFSIKTNGTGFAIAKSFADWGKNPTGGLVQGPDGNYYGMTKWGGAFNNYGTIFKITSTGILTVLHQFNFTTDGAYPYGDLTLGGDGNFYGLTSAGGINNHGTIFKITPVGIFTLLRAFTYATDGGDPQGTLALAVDGNFYGITRRGGSTGWGTIFKYSSAGVYSVIKTLNGTTDGGYCYGSITNAKDSNFYGITYGGGTFNHGTIFKVTPTGVYTVLRNLNTADGFTSTTNNGLVQHPDGFLYGMMYGGGLNNTGTIFKVSTTGTFTLLRNLITHPDGSYPYGALVVGTDGNLYGMNSSGGLFNGGTIFKISTSGIYTLIKDLTLATDGGNPEGNLFKGSDGLYYGMTYGGGTNLYGTAFKISATGTYTVITRFNGGIGGGAPFESLVQGTDYALYGTTNIGGAYDFGTVFRLCGATTTVLRSFNRNPESVYPRGSLIQATDGFFYGMASQGGNNSAGTIFKISSTGVYTILHHFVLATEGGNPQGSLIQGADGYLYGMTKAGGTNNAGTIFKISTAGVFIVIHHLLAVTDGGNPEGGLIKGPDSNFYGMTYSNARIFKISPNGVIFTILKTLNAVPEGSNPSGSLVLGADGNFYGTCYQGGSFGRGTIFKMTPAGIYTVLKHLNPISDGGYPGGSLVQAADGNFYGLTSVGGTYNAGTIFRISNTGVYAVIRHLDLLIDGGAPFGSLIIQKMLVLIANPQSITVTEDVPKAIVLSGSGATPLTYTVVTPPKNGTVTAGTLANRTYTPKANYWGKDSFYFTANFSCFSSPPAKVLITVTAVNNDAPVLDSIRSKKVKTGTLLTFTAKATEYDSAQTKTFSLIAPLLAGATIDPITGVFKWTPATSGVSTVKVRVSDNGVPVLFDEEVVTITAATNFAPVLDPIPAKSIKTGTLLMFTAKATDFDAGQTKKFSLIGAPAGATIDTTTGVFKWTPAISGVFTMKVRVTDNGVPVLFDEKAVTITAATNFAPVLDSIRSKTIKAGILLTFTAKATDIDAGQTKKFSLAGVAPAGATIDTITGIFKWTPAAGGVFIVNVRVTDNGIPVLFDEEAVTITAVTNFAPVLDSIRSKTVKAGSLLTFTAKATDVDAGQTKTFSLLGAPVGAAIVATTGVFTWTPTIAGVFIVKVRVTDNGVPVLFDEEAVTITVVPNSAPVLDSVRSKTVKVGTLLTFTAKATDVDAGQTKTFSLIDAPVGATIVGTTGIFTWTPSTAGVFKFKVRVTDNGLPALFDEEEITVTVSAARPASGSQPGKSSEENLTRSLVVYPNPVSNKCIVKFDGAFSSISTKMYDMKGALVRAWSARIIGKGSLELDMTGITQGQYILQFNDGKKQWVVKLVKL
jgi:uncharacterized repeat protein (TIGR03803 family)